MSQATLNGLLSDDGGLTCNVWFEWGTSTDYGNTTPIQGGFTSGMMFSALITGLAPGVVYHFRAVAQNAIGIAYGNDQAFATLVEPGIPVMIDDAALLGFLEVQ